MNPALKNRIVLYKHNLLPPTPGFQSQYQTIKNCPPSGKTPKHKNDHIVPKSIHEHLMDIQLKQSEATFISLHLVSLPLPPFIHGFSNLQFPHRSDSIKQKKKKTIYTASYCFFSMRLSALILTYHRPHRADISFQ
jgi:hypothetical protein